MRSVILFALTCLVSGAGSAFAAAVPEQREVVFAVQRPARAACEVSALRFKLSSGEESTLRFHSPVQILEGSVARTVEVPAGAAGVAAVAEGCWVEPLQLSAREFTMRVWPVATVLLAVDRKLPERTIVDGAAVDVAGRSPGALIPLECGANEGSVRCTMPAVRPLHVRVQVAGYLPVYALNVAAGEGESITLGPEVLERGFAVEGRAVETEGVGISGARVTLTPAGDEASPSERLLRTHVALTDRRGRFEFSNVASGTWRVSSAARGWPDAAAGPFAVEGERVLLEPLVHAPAGRVVLAITPPAAPDGTPWRVRLMRRGDRASESLVLVEGEAAPSGTWTSPAVPRGGYTVVVLDAQQSEFGRAHAEAGANEAMVPIALTWLTRKGTLLRRGEGVAGRVTFTHTKSPRRVRVTAGEDGSFSAWFPTPGTWRVEIRTPADSASAVRLSPVVIAEDKPEELRLELAGGRIDGTVVDRNGKGAEAVVTLTAGGRVVAQVTADAAGAFVIANLSADDYSIEAESERGFVPPMPAKVGEDEEVEVTLALEPWKRLRGVVRNPSGAAASGAFVRIYDPATGIIDHVIANAEGAFAKEVNATGALDLIVIAPPAPVSAMRVPLASWQGETLTIGLAPISGTLVVAAPSMPPWPAIAGSDGVARPLILYLAPSFGGPLRELRDGALELQVPAGRYRVCLGDDCRQVVVAPGGRESVSFVPSSGGAR